MLTVRRAWVCTTIVCLAGLLMQHPVSAAQTRTTTVVESTVELENVLADRGQVVDDASASGGKLVRVDLSKSTSGPLLNIPLPAKEAGKYRLLLRVKSEPVDAFSDAFVLSAGDTTRTLIGTDNPGRQDGDYRLWIVPFVYDAQGPCVAKLALARPNTREPKTVALLLDSAVLQVKSHAACIESVRPDKVLYEPGEEIACEVKLRNLKTTPLTLKLQASELADLNASRRVAQPNVTLKPGDVTAVVLRWKAGMQEYGREVRVELFDHEQLVDTAADYYNVADNVWKVALLAPIAGIHMTDPASVYCSAKTEAQVRQAVLDARSSYGNFHEFFAWAPDDALDMTPTQDFWISGQGCYQHQRSRLMLINSLLNENGIRPITYAKSAASGPPAYEYMRRHPEYSVGRYQVQFDQQQIRDWDTQIPGQEKTIFYTWNSLVIDITQPKLVEACINEILDSARMFGWRGARYDDHYTYWGKPYDDISTRNMQMIFDLGRNRDPRFVWGFNYITHGTNWVWPGAEAPPRPWQQKLTDASLPADPTPPRWDKVPEVPGEFSIMCRNGGYVMNEEARGAHSGTYTDYARLLTNEARIVRKLGGHYGPIPFDPNGPGAFDNIFPDILRAATRSHTYGLLRAGTNFAQFLTRYSAFIYGTGLKPLDDPEAVLRVQATPGAWWHMFSYRYEDGTDKSVVVHLLGPPRKDKINTNTDGAVTRIRNAAVTYTGPGKVVQAWELSPFIEGFARQIPVTNNVARPSDFYLWKIVVLRLQGG